MLAVTLELAKRVAERSPPVKSTSAASALAMFNTLSVRALTSSREYIRDVPEAPRPRMRARRCCARLLTCAGCQEHRAMSRDGKRRRLAVISRSDGLAGARPARTRSQPSVHAAGATVAARSAAARRLPRGRGARRPDADQSRAARGAWRASRPGSRARRRAVGGHEGLELRTAVLAGVFEDGHGSIVKGKARRVQVRIPPSRRRLTPAEARPRRCGIRDGRSRRRPRPARVRRSGPS